MLDIIIRVSADTYNPWKVQSVASVEAAISRVNDVGLVVVDGVVGSSARALANGLALSKADYFAVVDDDDFLLPHALTSVMPHVRTRPACVFARELQLFQNGLLRASTKRHHLSIYRRDIADGVDLTQESEYLFPYGEAAEGEKIDVYEWIYVHRVYMSRCVYLRNKHKPNPWES